MSPVAEASGTHGRLRGDYVALQSDCQKVQVAKRKPAPWLVPLAAGAALAALFICERRQPLRSAKLESDWRRVPRNFALAATVATVAALCERPLVDPVAKWVEQRRSGLIPKLYLRPWGETLVGLILLDYTLYWWHVLLHRQPSLWRCHVVHHADRMLDSSTAFRFHAFEFLASIPWRLAQVTLLGIRPRTLNLWRSLTFTAVVFHHSNLRLPARLERLLGHVLMTPKLHGIHHSVSPAEANSNFSSGLTLWDRLHGSLRRAVSHENTEIGVQEFRDPDKLTLKQLLLMPLVHKA